MPHSAIYARPKKNPAEAGLKGLRGLWLKRGATFHCACYVLVRKRPPAGGRAGRAGGGCWGEAIEGVAWCGPFRLLTREAASPYLCCWEHWRAFRVGCFKSRAVVGSGGPRRLCRGGRVEAV